MSLKAYYDPVTDTIRNATPFTYAWFHERRHQEQYKKNSWLKTFDLWSSIIAYALSGGMLIVCLIHWRLDLYFYFTGLVYTPIVLLGLFLEIDAFIFGTISWMKYRLKL